MIRQPVAASTIGLADSLSAPGRGGRIWRGSWDWRGRWSRTRAASARTRSSDSGRVRSSTRDGTAVPDLRHDDLVRLVRARADRSLMASKSRGVSVRPADRSVDRLVGRERGREPSRSASGPCRGP